MILGIILRNFKSYKNINFIPLSTGENICGVIGNNGVGKSSILEALDFFFNHQKWIQNINTSSSDKSASYVCPIFAIEKEKIPEYAVLEFEEYSNAIWSLMSEQSQPITFINSNYKSYIDQIRELVNSYPDITKESHFLCPIGLNANGDPCLNIFKGEFLNSLKEKERYKTYYDTINNGLTPENENKDNIVDFYIFIETTYLIRIYGEIVSHYNYIYVPKDVDPEKLVQFETKEVQILIGQSLQDIVAKFFPKLTIQNLSRDLKTFVENLSSKLDGYVFKVPGGKQLNLKAESIYSLIISDFFSLRELHKEGCEKNKDIPMKNLSSGEKQQAILTLIHNIIQNYRQKSDSLIIGVDEPESSLHISACYSQFEKMYEISHRCSQVIFSSHWYGFIPAMISGNVTYLSVKEEKHNAILFNISKYREEIKHKETEYGKIFHDRLPLDIMLKSSNDFIQSVLTSVIADNPYNWLICEGSSELIYFK